MTVNIQQMSEEDILEFWFEQKSLAESTQEGYITIMEKYCEFTGKTIKELYYEALHEEKTHVFLPERGYSKEILKYRKHLKKIGKAAGTQKRYIHTLKSFYDSLSVIPPKIKFEKGDLGLEKNFGHLLTKEEINKLIAVSGPRDRAIIYVMANTGMSQNEMRHLKIDILLKAASKTLKRNINNVDELFRYENELETEVLTLEVKRYKSNYRYITFIAPESTKAILLYFKERKGGLNQQIRIKNTKDYIFLNENGFTLSKSAVNKIFKSAGIKAGFEENHEEWEYRSWRSHGMRRYFISTVINKTGNHVAANFMAGHKISEQDRTYWRADPDDLKQIYLEALPFLSLENVEVQTIQDDDLKIIGELKDENQAIRKENKEIKEYFELLKRRDARSKS